MTYGEKVLSRLLTPGMLILVVGAVVVYCSGMLARWLAPDKAEKTNVLIKAVGCGVALLGAVLLFIRN